MSIKPITFKVVSFCLLLRCVVEVPATAYLGKINRCTSCYEPRIIIFKISGRTCSLFTYHCYLRPDFMLGGVGWDGGR